jgi:hypothetical protein
VGTCTLSQFDWPTTASIASVYGRRAPSGGANGIVAEDAVRDYGTWTFGQLCSTATTTPTGWPGYLVRYSSGGTQACARAQAGQSSVDPSICVPGTITYWTGSALGTINPISQTGGSIPVGTVTAFTSGGFTYNITASLATGPSYTSEIPAGATGTTDRTEVHAFVGSPIVGTITYQVKNGSGTEIMDLTITIDLGSLSANARYAP